MDLMMTVTAWLITTTPTIGVEAFAGIVLVLAMLAVFDANKEL